MKTWITLISVTATWNLGGLETKMTYRTQSMTQPRIRKQIYLRVFQLRKNMLMRLVSYVIIGCVTKISYASTVQNLCSSFWSNVLLSAFNCFLSFGKRVNRKAMTLVNARVEVVFKYA